MDQIRNLDIVGSICLKKGRIRAHAKKKICFAHVLDDLIYQGFDTTNITTKSLEGRMRTLLSAYKAAKDNGRRTGAASCIIPYWDEMEELFGNKPTISNKHSRNYGVFPSNASSISAASTSAASTSAASTSAASTSASYRFDIVSSSDVRPPSPTSPQASTIENTPPTYSFIMSASPPPSSAPPSSPPPSSPPPSSLPLSPPYFPPSSQLILNSSFSPVADTSPLPPTRTSQHRKSWKEKYYAEKIQLKKKHYEKREELMEHVKKELQKISTTEQQKLELLQSQSQQPNNN